MFFLWTLLFVSRSFARKRCLSVMQVGTGNGNKNKLQSLSNNNRNLQRVRFITSYAVNKTAKNFPRVIQYNWKYRRVMFINENDLRSERLK